MNTKEKIDKYLNEREKGSTSPKQLADDFEPRLIRAISYEIEDWKKEIFDPVEGMEYEGQMDEALAILAKSMINYFQGMKKGAQKSLKSKRK